jgi:hypothetical protein
MKQLYVILFLFLYTTVSLCGNWYKPKQSDKVPLVLKTDSLVYSIEYQRAQVLVRVGYNKKVRIDVTFKTRSQTHVKLSGRKIPPKYYYAEYLGKYDYPNESLDSLITILNNFFENEDNTKFLILRKYRINQFASSPDYNKNITSKNGVPAYFRSEDSIKVSKAEHLIDELFLKQEVDEKFQQFFWNLPDGFYGYLNGSLRTVKKPDIKCLGRYP